MTNIKNKDTSLCPTCEGNGYVVKEEKKKEIELKLYMRVSNSFYSPAFIGYIQGFFDIEVLGSSEKTVKPMKIKPEDYSD